MNQRRQHDGWKMVRVLAKLVCRHSESTFAARPCEYRNPSGLWIIKQRCLISKRHGALRSEMRKDDNRVVISSSLRRRTIQGLSLRKLRHNNMVLVHDKIGSSPHRILGNLELPS